MVDVVDVVEYSLSWRLFDDSLVVVITETSRQLLIVHLRLVLALSPEPAKQKKKQQLITTN